jgi:glucose/arabinose dehydrogenase
MRRLASFAGLAVLAASGLALASRDTRAAAAQGGPAAVAAPALRLFPVTGSLPGLTGITSAGDARLFLTLQQGQIVIWDGAQVLPTPFLDISTRISCCGERGLLSTAFDPQHAGGIFYVNYTDLLGRTVVERFLTSADPNVADAGSGVPLLTIDQPAANHNGGQLQFGPDGFLYVGMGDGGGGNDPFCNAQSESTLLGKMLRIDPNQSFDDPPFYAIPPDNPFRTGGGPPEAWAFGLRNPWRFSFDRLTGDLFIGDVGQGRREEIDFQPAASAGGENYGWKVMEGTLCGDGDSVGCPAGTPPCNDPRYTLPILEYDHDDGDCSVTGGFVYRGLSIPDLYGRYVYGDFCTGRIWVATRQGGGWTAELLPSEAPQLTTFGEGADGELYVGTATGTLFRVEPTASYEPTIATISPTASGLRGPTLVRITGSNFTAQSEVFFGSQAAVVTVLDPNTLVALAPPSAPGLVDVVVQNPGALPAVRVGAFTYVDVPIVHVAPHGPTRIVDR